MTTLRVTRVVIDDRPYFPITRADGSFLGWPEIEALETSPGAAGVSRRLRCIVFDESQLPLEAWNADWRLLVDQRRRVDLPLELTAGSGVPVGSVEVLTLKAPGAIPDTTGHALIGEARLNATALADIAWQAIREQIFTHICAETLTLNAAFRREAEQAMRRSGAETIVPIPAAAILSCSLMPGEGAHSPFARILEAWEAPA